MFGSNDTNSQTANSNSNPGAVQPPAPINPFSSNDTPVESPTSSPTTSTPDMPSSSTAPVGPPVANDELLDLKQQALQSLQPLVGHLEQSPEEKFKTTMMLIQASDNSSLVKQAYEAATQITDEKARAQALLDVVNEINYFTHQPDETETKT